MAIRMAHTNGDSYGGDEVDHPEIRAVERAPPRAAPDGDVALLMIKPDPAIRVRRSLTGLQARLERSPSRHPSPNARCEFSQANLNKVARLLNERPCETLGWMSPAEKLESVLQ